jgi:glycosyltransferase involved in cell wall biosynthesis
MVEVPGVSVVIPTLNSDKTIEQCLESISKQDYPKQRIEIIIADGGSKDKTLGIARKFTNKIFHNHLKTGESGKALGFRKSTLEIIAFIDSDNILPGRDWLRRMVEPFQDRDIIGSEPISYEYRPEDKLITRYSAMMGMNDPLCFFLGNYDRLNQLTGKWTDMPHCEQDKGGYIKIKLHPGKIPTIGANGFMIRRKNLDRFSGDDYLFDIDVLQDLVKNNHDIRVAKVKVGIIHIFSGSISTFMNKQRRRIKDNSYYERIGLRNYPWKKMDYKKLFRFVFYTVTTVPLVYQAIHGWVRKRDNAWVFHIPACWITLLVYSWETLRIGSAESEMSREGWNP